MNPKLVDISKDSYTWFNATRNVKVTPLRFFYPKNKEDIAEIILDAEAKGLRVRAVGSGHSYSEAPKGKDYLLSMKHMAGVWKTPVDTLKEKYKSMPLATAEAGTILKKLTRHLDKMGLALINMGAVDFQTISGAMMTGTHGTGIKKPAVPDMVRSLRMVATGGEFLQIEPTDGITDPNKFDQSGPIRLIQDDDIFNSTILSFGGMGIVYELTIEVMPQYWMKEKRYLNPWSKLKKELKSGDFMKKVESTDFVAIRVNPYEVKGDHRCAVVEQGIVPESQRPKGLSGRMRNIISAVLGNLEYLIESSIQRLRRKPKGAINTIQLSLWATKDLSYFGKSYKVLFQSGNALIRYGMGAEFTFEANGTKIVEVIEKVFEKAEENAKEGGIYQSAHVSVRFVASSEAFLSPAYHRKTVHIGVPLLYGTIGDIEILERYQEMMIELGGIPHWGKQNARLYTRNDFIRQQFAMVDRWIQIREELDPKGTFLNDFIIQMGLSKVPAQV